MMTWEEMIALEPGLSQLLAIVSQAHLSEGQCKDDLWYGPGGFKESLLELAGAGARVPSLGSINAYNTTYDKMYGGLPKCECCHPIEEA
jgi:hypothetical protein